MAFAPIQEPKTELGRFRILSSNAGVRVSLLALGAMSLGTAWSAFLGSVDEEKSFEVLDYYADAGGNFIDTANNYQNEESEMFIGKWMASRKNRDIMFVATKFTNSFRTHDLGTGKTVNYGGNNKKSLMLSVNASLQKLQTTYIDLLYVHWWDWSTSVEELMDSLHILVEQGKVLYLAHAKTPFSVYQGRWNVMDRDFEREIIPMARHFGMALCPWMVLGGGELQSKKQLEARKVTNESSRFSEQSEDAAKVSEALEKVAAEHGTNSVQQTALAYVMKKARNVIPLVGCRKPSHLEDNIKALSIRLTDSQVKYIESVKPFDIGFPLNFIGDDPKETGGYGQMMELLVGAKIAFPSPPKPVGYE